MTSENELDIIKTINTIENKEELNNEIPLNKQESEVLTIPVEETGLSKTEEEEEPIHVEKPKRAGRKKRDVTLTADVKNENLNNDNAMDTQPLFEQPVIVEGKRSRKPTSRLELSELATPKKELSIPEGHGKPLGEIEYIDYQITHASSDTLSRMHTICFGRRAGKVNIRKNIREFNGFDFEQDSDEYQRHLSNLIKLKKDQLRSLTDMLGLPAIGRNDEQAERIIQFLMKPVDEGKQIPERKMSMRTSKKSSTNSKESLHIDEEDNEIEEKTENGDYEEDDDDDDLFNEEEEDGEEEAETDDDYIGSDEESGLITKDDPDDFVYRPGKKTPKKRPSLKRSRSGNSHKRKRGTSASKRGRKKSKVTPVKKAKNESITVPAESVQTNEDNSPNDNTIPEPKNNDLNHTDIKLSEQNDTTTNNINTDVILATS